MLLYFFFSCCCFRCYCLGRCFVVIVVVIVLIVVFAVIIVIEVILFFGVTANTWRPNHKDKSITDNFRSQRKNSEDKSEEISYKHKIKNHGNLVLKYKVLGKFKRRKKGALSLCKYVTYVEYNV